MASDGVASGVLIGVDESEEVAMVTAVFLIVFGGILVGFMVYKMAFSGGRKGKAAQSEVNAQRQTPTPGRSTGTGDN